MKIKMVKMGIDIDETRNHRIRGIVPTDDGKFLFMEICEGNRPNIGNTGLSKKDYETKYPYQEYIHVDACFRVDIPEDYYKNHTQDYRCYERSYTQLEHSSESITNMLKHFNKNIDEVELVNEHYIDDYCNEKGFFKLYDDRLKHEYKPLEIIWCDLKPDGNMQMKTLYTCLAANGHEYNEEFKQEGKIKDFIDKYGVDKIKNMMEPYFEKKSEICNNPKFDEIVEKLKIELFNNEMSAEEMECE